MSSFANIANKVELFGGLVLFLTLFLLSMHQRHTHSRSTRRNPSHAAAVCATFSARA